MTTYEQYSKKALGLALIVAPALLVAGALALLLDIGVSVFGVSSWVEGIFMSIAFLLFVPIYLGLSSLLGKSAPRLGLLCAVLGVGIGFGIVPATDRILQAALDQSGYDVPIFSVTHAGSTPIVIWMGLGILLASILLGSGFLRYGGIPRFSAICLILAPIVFVMGQGGDETIAMWQVKVMYPLGTVIWFLALAPIGMQLLNERADEAVERRDVQTAV